MKVDTRHTVFCDFDCDEREFSHVSPEDAIAKAQAAGFTVRTYRWADGSGTFVANVCADCAKRHAEDEVT